MRYVLPLALLLALPTPGCKKEPVPEHVAQQKQRERKREQRRKKERKEAEKLKKRDAGADNYRLWSPAVRQAFYTLYRARSHGLPQKAKALAQLGLPAATALRTIAANKHHSPKKQALASFMLVDLNMFRPRELAKMAREHQLPFLQRGAIEGLIRIGNGETEAELDKLQEALPKMPVPKMPVGGHRHGHGHSHGHDHKRPLGAPKERGHEHKAAPPVDPKHHPMVAWLRVVRRKAKGKKWAYSAEQLDSLDKLLHADSPQKLRIAVNNIKDGSVEQGLLAILSSPVSRPSVQAGVAFKIVEPQSKNSRRLRQLCEPKEHQLVRMQAARALLQTGNKRDIAFVAKLAESPRDPMAPMLRRMMGLWARQRPSNRPPSKSPK
jgi:hypothetical protein